MEARRLSIVEAARRKRHPQAGLIAPRASWRTAYLEEIDAGWRDYAVTADSLRTPEGFESFLQSVNSGKDWMGRGECLVRWLVDNGSGVLLGRVRIKNLSHGPSSSIWKDPSILLGGQLGFSICPRHRGKGLSTLMLSYALDECFALGAKECFCCIEDGNEPSMRAALSCGAASLKIDGLVDGQIVSVCRFELRGV